MVDGLRVVTSVMGSKNRRWACPLTQGILALQHKGVLRELEKQERLGGGGGLDKECKEIERAGPDARAEQWECGLRKENGIFSELKSIGRLNP